MGRGPNILKKRYFKSFEGWIFWFEMGLQQCGNNVGQLLKNATAEYIRQAFSLLSRACLREAAVNMKC
jgi:hypothetical protein